MSKPRKTAKVDEILTRANAYLGVPDTARTGLEGLTPQQAFRRGVAALLEGVLHDTGTYAGFGYLDPYVEGETDESRRVYYSPIGGKS